MNTKYLIRLDDAHPQMGFNNWHRMEALLDRYDVKPLIGVIPNCQDIQICTDKEDRLFWDKVKNWEDKGWSIALHGYNHVCASKEAGINPIHNRSEFAGSPLEMQKEKIKLGFSILRDHDITPSCFFAPSHTYDENTIIALREETPIRVISDTMASYPYYRDDMLYVPCQFGVFREWKWGGMICACYHPSLMSDESFIKLEHFLEKHADEFIAFKQAEPLARKRLTWLEWCAQKLYYTYRRFSMQG